MTNILRCDVCILGGGGAGIAAARVAAQRGARVVVVEKRALGGAYLTQTIPVEAFCAAALQNRTGISVGRPELDFARLRAGALAAVKDFARDYAPGPLAALNIEIIRAPGSFSRATRLEAGGRSIEARHFILATGAQPASSALPGVELIRPLAREDIFTIDRPPETLIIVGAGFQGLTLAQAFLRLGTRVSLIEQGAVLPNEDLELVAPVLTQLARDGLRLYPNAEVAGLEPKGSGVQLRLKNQPLPIEADRIMFAANPLPLVEGLGLKNARVSYANSGVLVDRHGRTSNRNIHAVGDAAGGPDSKLSGLEQAEHIARQLSGGKVATAPAIRVLSTEPELAMVGLTEAEAIEKHSNINVLRIQLGATTRARVLGRTEGHVKIVTNSAGILLGAGIVGLGARELIRIFGMAVEKRMNATELDTAVHAPAPAQAVSKAKLASLLQVGKAWQWRRN